MHTKAALLFLVFGAVTSDAQTAQNIPIRQLGPAEAVAPGPFDFATAVRPLSDGSLVVAARKQLLFFPPSLANPSVILDSTSSILGRTSGVQTVIIPARGDTTWIVDANNGSFLVIEPDGKLGRAIAAPKASDLRLMSTSYGNSQTMVDDRGRLLYRANFPVRTSTDASRDRTEITTGPDTFPVVRADFDLRTVDTIAVISIPSGSKARMVVEDSRMTMYMVQNPYPTTNAWTLLRDGTVVVAVGSDYHLDWISEGKTSSTPKMPFDWRRITDDEKVRIIDSLTRMTAARDSASEEAARRAGANTIIQRRSWVKPSELPDYYPPIRTGAVVADAGGNVWVLPTTSASAQVGLLYDVVNRKGEVFERVQLPRDCALGAFGPVNVVYLLCTKTGLERRRLLH